MSNFKKVKKIAGKAYKKVPKKKIVNKAATYGLKQIIGGPYLDILNVFYKKGKKKIISYAGSYAYDSFLRSKFARDKINTLPMSLTALVIRTISNFLIFSKFITGIYLVDFILSMIVTVIISLLAPFFYTSIKAHEEMFLLYTNRFMDRFMGPEGWDYVEEIKNRVFLLLGIIMVIVLQFVEINSRYLQEIIIHTIITGFISDKIQRWLETPRIIELYYGMGPSEPEVHMLTPKNFVLPPYKRFNICHTNNRVVINGPKSNRAIIVTTSELKNYKTIKMKTEKKDEVYVDIVENYRSNYSDLSKRKNEIIDLDPNIPKKLN